MQQKDKNDMLNHGHIRHLIRDKIILCFLMLSFCLATHVTRMLNKSNNKTLTGFWLVCDLVLKHDQL